MIRSIILAASIAVSIGVVPSVTPTTAKADGPCCCCFSCPDCRCKLTAEEVEVEKSCFEIECETICVPKVVFPWQTGKRCCLFPWSKKGSCDSCDNHGCEKCTSCVNNGAFLRTVKVLKTKKYKCPECEYTWSADDAVGCCDGGCCDGGGTPICDGCCASNHETTIPDAWKATQPNYQDSQSSGLAVAPVHSIQVDIPNPLGN